MLVWEPVVERIRLKIDSWKAPLLSKGWRLVWLRVPLSVSQTTYSPCLLLLLLLPLLEKCFCNFLWNDVRECKKYHLVDWNLICCLIQDGGLGIRCLRSRNKVLLGKWLWRFGVDRESLWRKVIVVKHDLLLEWLLKDPRDGYGTGWWKFILLCKEFLKFIRFKLGLGVAIRFWEDIWCGDIPLKVELNGIYSLVVNKYGSVADNFEFGDGGGWISCLRKNFNDWEFEELARLLRRLEGVCPVWGVYDS